MADISQITLPSGSTYNLKDAWARNQISTITGTAALTFKGVSSTPLVDGGTATPTLDGTVVPIADLGVGDIYFYGSSEYIWGPNPNYVEGGSAPENVWHELGNLSGLGGLAYKNSASTPYQPTGSVEINITTSAKTYAVSATTVSEAAPATYTPGGSVGAASFTGTEAEIVMSTSYTPTGNVNLTSTPKQLKVSAVEAANGSYQPQGTISALGLSSTAGTTTAINNPTPKSVMMGLATTSPGETAPSNAITYWSVSSETLSLYQIGYNTGNSINTSSVTVKTGDTSYSLTGLINGRPTFTGTSVNLNAESFNLPTGATFDGAAATISGSTRYTPAGINSTASFQGTPVHLVTESITLPDTINGVFKGTETTIEVS